MLEISQAEKKRLEELAAGSGALARRASIILASRDPGASAVKIARALGVSTATVRQWRSRFVRQRLAGLADERRRGAPRQISDEARASILNLNSDGLGTREIARRLRFSQSSVSRIVREERGRLAPDSIAHRQSDGSTEALAIQLFESLADEAPWARFLDRMRAATKSDYCTLVVFSGSGPRPTVIVSGAAPLEGAAAYVEKYHPNELLTDLPEGKVVALSDIFSPDELRATEFYKEYLGRYGVGHVLGVDLGTVREITGRLRLSRLEERSDYGPEERAVCQRITPYLRAALDLFVKRIDTEAEKEALSATVSGMSVGSIMVDPEAHILEANPPALRVLEQRDGIFLSGDRLRLSSPEKSKQLHELIRENAEASRNSATPAAIRAILIDRPSGRESISLLVRPATAGAGGKLIIRPTAVIHLVDPAQPRVKMIDALVQLFGLTAAEAKVAVSISNGFSISETAQAGGTSKNTVRSQVRSIFSKMGISRQSDLIRAVLTSVALLSLQDAP